MSSPNKVAVGQRGKVTLVTKSHGALRVGMVKSYEPAPDMSQKSFTEVDAVGAVKIVNIDSGVAGKIGYAEKNGLQVEAGMMDMEVAIGGGVEAIQMDHTKMRDFSLLIRMVADQDDTVFGAKVVLGCVALPPGIPVAAEDIMMRDMSFRALRILEIKGMDVRHVRVRTVPASGPLATPAALADGAAVEAGGGNFLTGDMVYIRTALVNAVITSSPVPSTPITRASEELAHQVAADNKKITLTVPAPNANTTLAVYAGRFSGGETFVGIVAAGNATLDILDFPDPQNTIPPRNNTSAAYQHQDDLTFAGAPEGFSYAVDLTQGGGKPALPIIPSGLKYLAVLKNGEITPFFGDESSSFGFSASGQTFYLGAAPSDTDYYDLFYPVAP